MNENYFFMLTIFLIQSYTPITHYLKKPQFRQIHNQFQIF